MCFSSLFSPVGPYSSTSSGATPALLQSTVKVWGTWALTPLPRPGPEHFTLLGSTSSLTGTLNGLPKHPQKWFIKWSNRLWGMKYSSFKSKCHDYLLLNVLINTSAPSHSLSAEIQCQCLINVLSSLRNKPWNELDRRKLHHTWYRQASKSDVDIIFPRSERNILHTTAAIFVVFTRHLSFWWTLNGQSKTTRASTPEREENTDKY